MYDDGEDEEICGESRDHDLPEPEFVQGFAAVVCRLCGAELFLEEDEL